MKTTQTLAIIIILLILHGTVNAQFHQWTIGDAGTTIDYPDGDGMASDACSSAEIFIGNINPWEVYGNLESWGCVGDINNGQPYVYYQTGLEMIHNQHAPSSIFGHEVPYTYSYTLEIEAYASNSVGDVVFLDYETGHGSDFFQTSRSSFQLLGNGNHLITFDNDYGMYLPNKSNSFGMDMNISYSTDEDGGHGFTGGSNEFTKILLPSQFYSDNGLTSPSVVTFPNPSGGSTTLETDVQCANNLYFEKNSTIGSYTYSAADTIFFNSEIPQGKNVTLSAGTAVIFGCGFSVGLGGSLSTQTYTGCTN